MTPLDLARAFLDKGREDEVLLERIVSDENIADSLFGFHAQQAVEKYLKSVLATDQERPERTHDLGVLADQCRESGRALPPDLEGVTDLSRYAVLERYPLTTASAIDRVEALALVVGVREWAESVLGSAS